MSLTNFEQRVYDTALRHAGDTPIRAAELERSVNAGRTAIGTALARLAAKGYAEKLVNTPTHPHVSWLMLSPDG